ncbi:hypothetical protein [Roseiconus lacunae]|nr:hypothetical protein [Roseiconus lacunae]
MPQKSQLSFLPAFATLVLLVGCSPPATFRQQQGSVYATLDSPAAFPTGMRRTKDGWEDASTWHWKSVDVPQSLPGWIEEHKQREPGWIRRVMDRIRSTPPLMVGVIQIASIAAITAIAQSYRKVSSRPQDGTPPAVDYDP